MFKALVTGKFIQIIALAAIACWLGWSALETQINVDGRGNRIDSPGAVWSCPNPGCDGILPTQLSPYDYQCRACGTKFNCKLGNDQRIVYRSITRGPAICGK